MSLPESLKATIDTLIGEDSLTKRLAEGKPLNVKLGVDPTRADLTFGHLVVFNKLRQFQDFGHQAVLIIGDFTTLIGDPSGRSNTRPVLTKEEIKENAETYLKQAFMVLKEDQTKVYYNSEWFGKMGFEDALSLARKMTVARMLERDDFQKRYTANSPISIVEFLYPLLQGYDSLMVEADIELGGTDQLFNLLVGRHLQKEAGLPEQAVMTLPLLIGLDGSHKMSKSLDNYIAFNDSAKDMFGKVMSVSDELMWDYYRLLLLASEQEVNAGKAEHPMKMKKQLALRLTERFHGKTAAEYELNQFETVFSRNELPDDMPSFQWEHFGASEVRLLDILAATQLFSSKKEIRRLIEQGAVKINDSREADPFKIYTRPTKPMVIQAGKRTFLRIE